MFFSGSSKIEIVMTLSGNAQAPLAIVLPHSESFQHTGAGAISICVRDGAAASGLAERIKILGEAVPEPFDAARFVAVTPAAWWYGRRTARYVHGVINVLRELSPAYIEVHNRPVYVAALRKAFPRTPILLYIHNDPRTLRGIREVAQRARCLEQVSAAVCVSAFIRRCMLEGLESHPHARKVRVVLNGIDTAALFPGEQRRREIIFVGRLSPQKGGLLFARAALQLKERLPEWRFVLVGARSFAKPTLGSDYERQVVEAMQQLGARGEITGYLPRVQAMARLRQAAIAVIPSQWDDPCPLSVIEALAGGCAVAASPRGGIPDLINDAGVLIDSAEPGDWAERLATLAEDTALRRHYQEAARNRAVRYLDIHHTSAQLDAIRLELMNNTIERGR
jgi:UDP-glucose:(glucosyl)LPS alpha-1,2-glucosyltransferase